MADMDELEKVGKKADPPPAKASVDVKGSLWEDTSLAIATYIADPGEFTHTIQGVMTKMRQNKSRSVSYLELTSKDGKTVRVEVYDVSDDKTADGWPEWHTAYGV